jgi:protein-L-isoaspartate O-methyltransferase
MGKATELAVVRRTYAKHVLAEAQVEDPRIEAAFAAIPREDFLWLIPKATCSQPRRSQHKAKGRRRGPPTIERPIGRGARPRAWR